MLKIRDFRKKSEVEKISKSGFFLGILHLKSHCKSKIKISNFSISNAVFNGKSKNIFRIWDFPISDFFSRKSSFFQQILIIFFAKSFKIQS